MERQLAGRIIGNGDAALTVLAQVQLRLVAAVVRDAVEAVQIHGKKPQNEMRQNLKTKITTFFSNKTLRVVFTE